jgi:hypothetical protein
MQLDVIAIAKDFGVPVSFAAAMFWIYRDGETRHKIDVVKLKEDHINDLKMLHDHCEARINELAKQSQAMATTVLSVVQENTRVNSVLVTLLQDKAKD